MKIRTVALAAVVAVLAVGLPAQGGSALALPTQGAAAVSHTPERTWQTNGNVLTIAYGADGTVYLGGKFTKVRPPGAPAGTGQVTRRYAAAFKGDKLLPWNPNPDKIVHAIAVHGSTVYLGGEFDTVLGQTRRRIAAVTTGGRLTDFKPTVSAKVRAIEVNSTGSRIYVGGFFTKPRSKVAAFTASGSLVKSFTPPPFSGIAGTGCKRCVPVVKTLDLSGGKLYVGGIFASAGSTTRNSLAAVDPDSGSLLGWAPKVYRFNSRNDVVRLVVHGSRVYIVGDFYAVNGRVSPNIVAVRADTGAIDTSWVATSDGGTNALEVTSRGVYVGGHFDYLGGPNAYCWKKGTCTAATVKRRHIGFISHSGTVEPWNPAADSKPGVYALAAGAGRLAVGGTFTEIGNSATYDQQGFAQFSIPEAQAASKVRLKAAYYNSPGRDSRSNKSLKAEYILIKNYGSKGKRLTGWTLRDRDGKVYEFPRFKLRAGRGVKVHTGRGSDTRRHLYMDRKRAVWDNDGDVAKLRKRSGKAVDKCRWDGGSRHEDC